MPFYMKLGHLPKKRHVQFRRPDGALYSEELFGTEGFVGPTSTMYHIHPPTQVTGWKKLYSTAVEFVECDVMRMRHSKTAAMKAAGDAITGRVVLYGNSDVEMGICIPKEPMNYHYKNGQGDECLFIHFGSGVVHTLMGSLKFGQVSHDRNSERIAHRAAATIFVKDNRAVSRARSDVRTRPADA